VQGSKAKAYDNLKHEVITGESPRPRQRWVKVVTMVTTLHFWSKKPEPPCPHFEIPDVSIDNIWADNDILNLLMEPETSFEMTEQHVRG
jgi:hypothetical protein